MPTGVKRGRPHKQKLTDPAMPLKCSNCNEDLTSVVLDPDKPVCPFCGTAFKLPDQAPAPVTESEKPRVEVTVSTGRQEMTGTLNDYGIRARVVIPEISDIEVNKVAIGKGGKLITKITFQTENVNEVSLLRIIHMMSQGVRMGISIVAEKLQTDFLDIVDPATNKMILAQVSRRDLEDKGFGISPSTDKVSVEANKVVQDAKDRAREYSKSGESTGTPPATVATTTAANKPEAVLATT